MLTEKRFDTGELTLAYLDSETDAPPLVLLHGLTGWRADWRNFAPLLTPNWRVYMVELRGHGNSDRGAAYACADYARDIIAFLKFVGEPVVLVGFSLGAIVALTTASQYPEGVKALIPIDPPLLTGDIGMQGMQSEGSGYFHWVYNLTKTNPSYETVVAQVAATLPEGTDAGDIMAMADQLSRVAPETVDSAIQGKAWDGLDFTQTIQQIRVPTLMIHGDWMSGAVVREQDVQMFKQNLPSAEVVRLPDAGHLIPIEHPDFVLEQLNLFLASLG